MNRTEWWQARLSALPKSAKPTVTVAIKAAHKLHYRTKRFSLPISIENMRGSWRRWSDGQGHRGASRMKDPYGYIRLSQGLDGEKVDCFLGPDSKSPNAYLVYQLKENGDLDEVKVVLGVNSISEARKLYLRNYGTKGQRMLGWIEKMSLTELRNKLKESRANPEVFI